ncbi:MAG: MoxR-like ATPase [Abditibacteriota bacterium]|nr:MoxR-like ATPase [Abditibacteriota bacterium]
MIEQPNTPQQPAPQAAAPFSGAPLEASSTPADTSATAISAASSEVPVAGALAQSETGEVRSGATRAVQNLADAVRREVAKAVVGQDEVVSQFLIAVLVGGHVLLEGVPGVAKTLTAKALSHAIAADFKRIQFTPDLMPSDVVGTNVFDVQSAQFSLRPGPVFTDILLADEINRTPPKTQAALLEAMQERRVTIDGEGHPLSSLFSVFATQNPIDYEGTYPLPEAQLDRFLMKVTMTYPSPAEEIAMLARVHAGFNAHELASAGVQPVAGAASIEAARSAVQQVTVSDGLLRYITEIVGRTRNLPALTLGASPRASIALLECSKALAALSGRDYVLPEDVKAVALPVLRHRLLLRAESEMEGVRTDDVIRSVLGAVEVPR